MGRSGEASLRVLEADAAARLGRVHHVLFDFDGTISVLRQGWEEVMAPLMVEMICDGAAPDSEIVREVDDYVDASTGIVTIEQMEWLARTVRSRGRATRSLTASEYKAIYLMRLDVRVDARLARLADGSVTQEQMMVAGARQFVEGLAERGLRLYLASGTDHHYLVNEASALGVARLFDGGLYGALDADDSHRKERIIQRILDEHDLHGDELLVVGDGPVEIREAVARDALALGIASDEVARCGWNPAKVSRLTRAGSHFLAPDFTHSSELLTFLFS